MMNKSRGYIVNAMRHRGLHRYTQLDDCSRKEIRRKQQQQQQSLRKCENTSLEPAVCLVLFIMSEGLQCGTYAQVPGPRTVYIVGRAKLFAKCLQCTLARLYKRRTE